ncbi:MAG: hypothetical protein ACYDA8_02845 [Deferrisomatales bacterium]
MKRMAVLVVGWAAVAAAGAPAWAQEPTIAQTRQLERELALELGKEQACQDLGRLVRQGLDQGLSAGAVAEIALRACPELDRLVAALVDAGVSLDVATQAAVFAGGDPVAVTAAVDQARRAAAAQGRVLAYTPPPEATAADRGSQVMGGQIASALWGAPVQDAGPHRTRAPDSPSRP